MVAENLTLPVGRIAPQFAHDSATTVVSFGYHQPPCGREKRLRGGGRQVARISYKRNQAAKQALNTLARIASTTCPTTVVNFGYQPLSAAEKKALVRQ